MTVLAALLVACAPLGGAQSGDRAIGPASTPALTPTSAGIEQIAVERLPVGGCGPLSATEPSYTPQLATTVWQFRVARRIDVVLRADGEEWCLAGIRSFDLGAEVVGRLSGSAAREMPWAAESSWREIGDPWSRAFSEIEVVTDTDFVLSGVFARERGEGIRTLHLFAPSFGSGGPGTTTFRETAETAPWRQALESASALIIRARPLRRIEGPVTFPPVAIKDGNLSLVAAAAGVRLELLDMRRSGAGLGVAWERRLTRQARMDDRPIRKIEWSEAIDDLGNRYRPGEMFRQYVDPGFEFYQSFSPVPPPEAKTIRFTIARAVVLGDPDWKVTLPFR